LRAGLAAADVQPGKRRYVQKVHNLGRPLFDVDEALAIAAELEDEEIIRKLKLGK
jgi:hypothetical protein